MATLFGMGQPEMLPNGRVGGREPGALAEVLDCGIRLTGHGEAKAKLRLDEEFVRREMRRALQGNRRGNIWKFSPD